MQASNGLLQSPACHSNILSVCAVAAADIGELIAAAEYAQSSYYLSIRFCSMLCQQQDCVLAQLAAVPSLCKSASRPLPNVLQYARALQLGR
jgi:hypothetical protein